MNNTTLKTIADDVGFNPNPLTDADFDVTKLFGAKKVAANGIVYFPSNS